MAESMPAPRSAAQLLGISTRQAKRLWQRYQEQGIEGLKHRAAGRRSNRAKPEGFRKRVLLLVRDKYLSLIHI